MGFKPRRRGARFQRAALYSAIDAKRRAAGISWREVGRQAGVFDATILRLAKGHGPTVEVFGKLCVWLNVNPGSFYR